MKKLSFFAIILSLLIVSCVESNEKRGSREFIPEHDKNPALSNAENIAYKNGLLTWDKVNEIKFTFNVDRGEQHFERSFIWAPKTSQVTSVINNDTVTYSRNSQLDSSTTIRDQAFINDSFWLLAPYKLVWDEGTTISEKEEAIAPISKDTLHQITLTYTGDQGYTPGDAYDFYFGNDYIIKEWVYRKSNAPEPTMMTTFEDYKDFSGLKLATMHRNPETDFKLYFTDISVTTDGE